jgi:hypothetical protein
MTHLPFDRCERLLALIEPRRARCSSRRRKLRQSAWTNDASIVERRDLNREQPSPLVILVDCSCRKQLQILRRERVFFIVAREMER